MKKTDVKNVLLSLKDLNKSFGGIRVTNNLSLDLAGGVITSLVGPNGAGKTTLFNLITGNLIPDSGDILWEKNSILGMPSWKIARLGIARSFQDLKLFDHMSVYENVLTVMEPISWLWQPRKFINKTSSVKIEEILNVVKLAHKANVRAIDLSYAEKKFLSIARIMATESKIWLLDEPASGLDRSSYELFVALLRNAVSKGISICIIEHNLDIVVEISDYIAFLDQGALLAYDRPDVVLSDPHLASIYFGGR